MSTDNLPLYLPFELARDNRLNMGDKLLLARLIFLSTKSEDGIIFYPSELALKEFGLTKRQLNTHLQHLKSRNFIQIKVRLINNRTIRTIIISEVTDMSLSEVTDMSLPEVTDMSLPEVTDMSLSSSSFKVYKRSIYIKGSLPQTKEEIEPYFQSFVDAHIQDHPTLKNLDVKIESENFFLYYSTNDWKDKNGKPVKSVKARVNTWCSNWLNSPFKTTSKRSTVSSEQNTTDRAKNVLNMLNCDDTQNKFKNSVEVEVESVL